MRARQPSRAVCAAHARSNRRPRPTREARRSRRGVQGHEVSPCQGHRCCHRQSATRRRCRSLIFAPQPHVRVPILSSWRCIFHESTRCRRIRLRRGDGRSAPTLGHAGCWEHLAADLVSHPVRHTHGHAPDSRWNRRGHLRTGGAHPLLSEAPTQARARSLEPCRAVDAFPELRHCLWPNRETRTLTVRRARPLLQR